MLLRLQQYGLMKMTVIVSLHPMFKFILTMIEPKESTTISAAMILYNIRCFHSGKAGGTAVLKNSTSQNNFLKVVFYQNLNNYRV